jgi:hypothetical protein
LSNGKGEWSTTPSKTRTGRRQVAGKRLAWGWKNHALSPESVAWGSDEEKCRPLVGALALAGLFLIDNSAFRRAAIQGPAEAGTMDEDNPGARQSLNSIDSAEEP